MERIILVCCLALLQVELEVTLPGEGKDRIFKVAIKWMSCVSLQALHDALSGRLPSVPFETIQALDVVMRHLPSMRWGEALEVLQVWLGCFGGSLGSLCSHSPTTAVAVWQWLRAEAVVAFLLPVESRASSLDTEPFPESQSGPMAVCSQLRGALPSPSPLCSLGEGGSPQVGSAWWWKGGFKTASYPVCLWTDIYWQFCIKAAGLGGR